MLEASLHERNAFVTLTYRQEDRPEGGSLYPAHLRDYLKRIRHKIGRIRYFASGEYGEGADQHPHYHLALFGAESCHRGSTRTDPWKRPCCPVCTLHAATWGHGYAFLGTLTDQSAAYLAGYVVKKSLKGKGEEELAGRHPEFTRMSNKPGIGAYIADEVASTLMEHNLEKLIEDVPVALRHGRKTMPLGTYLRKRIRERIGRSKNAPQIILDKLEAELQVVRETVMDAPQGFKENALREALIAKAHGSHIRAKALHSMKRKGSI